MSRLIRDRDSVSRIGRDQIRDWKKRLKDNGKDIFSSRRQNSEQEAEALQAQSQISRESAA
jgi:hypothetical protein